MSWSLFPAPPVTASLSSSSQTTTAHNLNNSFVPIKLLLKVYQISRWPTLGCQLWELVAWSPWLFMSPSCWSDLGHGYTMLSRKPGAHCHWHHGILGGPLPRLFCSSRIRTLRCHATKTTEGLLPLRETGPMSIMLLVYPSPPVMTDGAVTWAETLQPYLPDTSVAAPRSKNRKNKVVSLFLLPSNLLAVPLIGTTESEAIWQGNLACV